MKRYLLFVIAFVCVSIGAWAGPDDPYEIMNTESWNNGAETAAKVKLNQAGNLSAAIAAITAENCQIIILETAPNVTFTPEDIAALSNLNYATIDLQQYKGDPFTFTNSNVKYVTLPSSWTKEDVKAAGVALSTSANFEAALCQGETNHEPFLTAYVNKPGTLINAIPHLAWTEANGNVKPEYKIGTGVGDCSKLNVLTAMGNICAKDISRRGVYDANGHYVINGIADENLDPAENKGKNTEGGQLYAGADAQGAVDGAIQGCYGIKVIDLRDAIIPDAYCADIVPEYGFITTNIREIWIPEDPNFKTIPADYLNCSCAVHQICIPGNIETIRTRAFAGSSVNYIWTTGSDPSVRYDNGATFITDPNGENEVRTQRYKTEVGRDITATDKFDPAVEYPLFQNGDDNSFNYGTFTLPASLKLIERFAFYSSTSVSDVYILTHIAPECHVDAFNSSQYHANNTVKVENMKKEVDDDGNEYRIINREAYNNGINQPMAILHYPENTGTPNTQRYTDPTREYSVATGYRDGKGNMMYFPTQTEFEVAEWQATYGYLWNAWNIERTWYNQEVTLGRAQAWYGGDFTSTGGFNQAGGQEIANQFYLDNPNPNPNNTDPTKTDRSYYDVRLNANGQPTLSQPAGLEWYYDQYRNGNQLYPQMETVGVVDDQGNLVMETVPVYDANGKIIYDELPLGSSYEGNYTRATEQRYNKAADGQYCHQLNQDDNGQYTIEYEYTLNENGDGIYCKAPWDATGNTWTTYYSWMGDIPRYDRSISGIIPYNNQKHNDGRPRFNISDDYVEYESYNNEYKQYLDRYNLVDVFVYSPANEGDPEPYYKMRTEEVQKQKVTKTNDYRGWHQFVLAGYGYNGVVPNEPIRSFISDNDWWTICEPFDLRYSDMIKFFGYDRQGFDKKIPYLSKLMYVVRDVKNQTITLMFSKNLMEYKEMIDDPTNHVHGTIDEETKWDPAELVNDDPIILHKGVPYLIRPNLSVDAQTGNINATRQFNVYKTETGDLYQRLNDARTLSAKQQMGLIYSGEYTVPAYVVGYDEEGAVSEGTQESKTITNLDGSSFTYTSGTINYHGKDVNYKISSKYTYTFVGSLYKSAMPQYCYFLGWDSNANNGQGGAAFWYSRVLDKSGWNWNNETGIICPNFDTSLKIKNATGINDPARWEFNPQHKENVELYIECDDFVRTTTGNNNAKKYTMDYGASMNLASVDEEPLAEDFGDQEVLSIDEIQSLDVKGEWYNVNGQKLNGRPTLNGVYVVNGKKYVVK